MNLKALILVLLVAGVCYAGISVNGMTVSRDTFRPGDPGVATLTVTNPSGADRVSAVTMTVNSPPEIIITSAPSLADISSGGSAIVTLPFTVKAGAKPGIYLVNVFFTGFINQGSTGTSQQTTNTASIPITVVNPPQISISTDTQSLSGINNVTIRITNNGGKASNLKITIAPPQGGSPVSNFCGATSQVAFYRSDQIFVPSVDTGGNVIANVTLDSRNAPDGPLDVPLVLQFDDEIGGAHSSNASLRLTVRNEKLNLGIIQQSDVYTKRTSNLTLELSNNGPDTIKDVRLSFQNSSVRLKNQDELKFGDLAPGQSATVSAVVDTDLPPGVNNIASTVSWIDKDVQKEESRTVPITITSDADVGVYLEAKPLPMTLGGQHTLSVLVSNLGSYRIDNVDVSISSPAMSSLDISDTQYIGGLNNDDFSTVQFLVKVNATAAGSYPIRMVVNYRDQSGELRQKAIEQMVNVYQPPQQEGDPVPIIVGVLVILVAVWWFKFRKPAK